MKPGTSLLRFARVWKSYSTGTGLLSTLRSAYNSSRIRIRCTVGGCYYSLIVFVVVVVGGGLLVCLSSKEVIVAVSLICNATVVSFRMQSVQVQQLLLWLPGSKPMSNTPAS